MDAVDLGIQIAESSIADCAAENGCDRTSAARYLLSEGLGGWLWPAGLTEAEFDIVRREAEQQLRNVAATNLPVRR